jgi:DnaJ-class molecular chaperone
MSGPQDIGRAYRLLGITRQCTDDQLNKAYRQLALRFHPDRHVDGAAETAQSKFQEISAAYEVLQEHRRTAGHAHPDPGMGSQRSDAGRSSGSGARHGSAGGGGDSGGEYTYNAYKGRSEFGYGGDPRSGEPNTWRGQHNEFGYNDSGASAGGSSRRNFQFTAEHGRGFRNPTHARAAQPMEVMYSKTELRGKQRFALLPPPAYGPLARTPARCTVECTTVQVCRGGAVLTSASD